MPSLKSIKLRIKSIKSTQKITTAMKMVAASKLKKAREQAENSTEYAKRMGQMLASFARSLTSTTGNLRILTGTGQDKIHLLVVITSDRGLCGSFNQNITKLVRKHIHELEAAGKVCKILCIGKKGYDLLKHEHEAKIIKTYDHFIGKGGLKFIQAKQIADFLIDALERDVFDYCSIFFNQFKSTMVQIPLKLQLIPLAMEATETQEVAAECEPSEEQIIEQLLPRNLAVQCFTCLLTSSASEQAARMTAMENATRNSGEMIKKLNLLYNRTRQAYITKELIEIISGSEAAA